MATSIHTDIQEHVEMSAKKIIREQLTPWKFFHSSKRLNVTRFDGTKISYEGSDFSGSPSEIFWSDYIEPFLKDLINNEISVTYDKAKANYIDNCKALDELEAILFSYCVKVYREMADIDQKLRGKGIPDSVQKRPIDKKTDAIKEYISERITSKKEIILSTPWYEKPWVKAWPVLVTMAVSIANLLLSIYNNFFK
ncbi:MULTISPECIES: hypothetical protein [unclassified Symbiopectobacterium]|uniref:hypothetical protein n=1 Tax=unclassified Symbiopectobacterium TaxID=2794573 RepID=UPI002226D835|nr:MULTISPECIES: hypothetical protein [unclassified Symbiopectobacterium]MCW2473381.1 hypothetical protein [Candidatus Symbiopectobacterium sp. NZEC151]MCW2482350.1 hypothetical protein [Candidatus Symbiopectobacterium sp. NZEC135]